MTIVREASSELNRTPTTCTVTEYLVLERAAAYKSEYSQGEIRPISIQCELALKELYEKVPLGQPHLLNGQSQRE